MPAAAGNSATRQASDQIERARDLGGECDPVDTRRFLEKPRNQIFPRLEYEFRCLSAPFLGGNEGAFDMRTSQLRDRPARGGNLPYHVKNLVERSSDGGKKQRGRAPAGVIVANRAKGLSGSFHSVPAHRPVHVQIDEARREEISLEVDDLFIVDRNFASQ